MPVSESEVRKMVVRALSQFGAPVLAGGEDSPASGPAALEDGSAEERFPIEASARHVHLTRRAVEALFGPGARLTKKRDLSQPGEFLSEQRLRLVTLKGEIANVAVLGPERDAVQAELSLTDARTLGIRVPVNLSGDLTGAADLLLVGEKGIFAAPASAIAARAHLHMTPADARRLGVKDGESVRVRVRSDRPLTFENVFVRVGNSFSLAMHIDFDESNACCLSKNTYGSIIR